MSRLLILFALAGLAAGCGRHASRAQGPFQKPTMPSPHAAVNGSRGPQPARPPQSLAGTPAAPAPVASDPDEVKLVPPRPPESPTGFAVNPPQPPRPPAVPESNTVVPAAATSPAPAPPSAAAANLAALKKLSQSATAKWNAVDTYEARLVRREVVGGTDGPTEEVLYQFRKEPHSVYMRNTGENGRGREVLYVKGKFGDKIHVITGAGDNRLVGAGFRAPPMSPDDPRVTSRSRHSIREAGFGRGIASFAALVEKVESGKVPPDALSHLGPVQRPEYPYPLAAVVQAIRPGDDKHSPNGGTRLWLFDPNPDAPSFGLPVLVITSEPNGKEVEYYCFDKFKLPAGLTDANFTPDRLGKK